MSGRSTLVGMDDLEVELLERIAPAVGGSVEHLLRIDRLPRDLDKVTIQDIALEHLTRERVEDVLLDDTAQRSSAVDRIITALGKPFACLRRKLNLNMPIRHQLGNVYRAPPM